MSYEMMTIAAGERTMQRDGLDFPRVVVNAIDKHGAQVNALDSCGEDYMYVVPAMPEDAEELSIDDRFILRRGTIRSPRPNLYSSASVFHETTVDGLVRAKTDYGWVGSAPDSVYHMGKLEYAGTVPELRPGVAPVAIDVVAPYRWRRLLFSDGLGSRSHSLHDLAFGVKYLPKYLDHFPPHNFNDRHIEESIEDIRGAMPKPSSEWMEICTPDSIAAYEADRERFEGLRPEAVYEALHQAFLHLRQSE